MRSFSKAVIFIVINLALICGFNYVFTQPSIVDIYIDEVKSGDYDTVILGQSHSESAYDPYVLGNEMGSSVFNCSRKIMSIPDTYYFLKEINDNKKIKTVIYDIDSVYLKCTLEECLGKDTEMFFHMGITGKLQYMKEVLADKNFNYAFNDYGTLSVHMIKRIPKVIKTKENICNNDEYNIDEKLLKINELLGLSDRYQYAGRGFSRGIAKDWEFTFEEKNISAADIKKENVDAFKKLATYCKDNDIKLVVVSSALPVSRLKNENIGEQHEYFKALTEELNLEMYDFNYIKKEYMSYTDDEYVDREGHMMGELAEKQTKLLTEILRSDNKERYFYDSYKEVLDNK